MQHPSPCSRSGLAGVAGFVLALLVAANSQGQETSGDQASLARYVPKDNLIFYLEYQGLDAHAEAWKKTAAYKILNNTPTGVMLETVAAQAFDKFAAKTIQSKRTGAEVVTMFKHIAQSGIMVAVVGKPEDQKNISGIYVVRNAFKDKTVRSIMARNLQDMNAPNTKPQAVVRAGHKIISGVNATGSGFGWWVEESKKEDIAVVFPKAEAADIFLETLDGKYPSAVDHPRRAELTKPENGFVPNGLIFLDIALLKSDKVPASLGLSNLKKLDYRWGFQDDALMTITRIATSGPRTGLLALLDGSTFERGKMPPIPESVTGFTVVSLDLKTTLDKLVAVAKTFKPDAEDQLNRAIDALKAKTKLRLKEDILTHLGPKVAWYILPAKSSATATASTPMLPNMMSMMMAGAGMDQIPKLAVVFDIDDPVAFGKVLDEAMAAANREFKAQAAGGDEPQPKSSRNRAPSGPAFEFRLMPGDTKTYVLQVPSELSGQIPASVRPTIRVGPKQVVLAVSADVARMALETKATWAPPSELSGAFQKLPSKLKVLDISDPRETLPGILASLPASLQKGVNTAILLKSGGAIPPAGPGNPAVPGSPGQPPGPRGRAPGGSGGSAGGVDTAAAAISPMAMAGSGGSGGSGAPGAPGGANPAGGANTFTFKIDASSLPSADSIKSLLFPSIFAIEVNDEEIRITTREAFPSLPDPSKVAGLSSVLPSMMGPGGPIPGMFPPPGGARPGAGPAPANPPVLKEKSPK